MFLVRFIVLAAVGSMGLIPPHVQTLIVDFSRWCLLVAIAALGTKTNARTLLTTSSRAMAVIIINSALLAALMIGGLMLVGS